MTLVATRDALFAIEDGVVTSRLTNVEPECVARVDDTILVGTVDDGLWRSAGDNFERVDGIPSRVTAVSAGHEDGEVWLGTEPSRVFRSIDAGATWTEREGLTELDSSDEWAFPPRPHTHHVRWLEPRESVGAWYVAIEAGALVRTTDGGATWQDRVPSGPRDTHTMATHSARPGWAAAAAGDGYFETTDGGDSWAHRESGLAHTYCWSVAVGADSELRVLSAARSARQAHRVGKSYVYRRVDDAWERVDGLPTGEGTYRYVLRPTDDGFLAVSNTGLFRSPDGDDWERLLAADAMPDAPVRGLLA